MPLKESENFYKKKWDLGRKMKVWTVSRTKQREEGKGLRQ